MQGVQVGEAQKPVATAHSLTTQTEQLLFASAWH